MLILFLKFILMHSAWKVPTFFFYSSTRMLLAAVFSLLLTIWLGPRFIKKLYELKIGQSIRMQECPLLGKLHEKKKDTPTMGGVLILTSMAISTLLWMDLGSIYTWILLLSMLFFGFIGGIDDYLKLKYKNTKGLHGKKKMKWQILFSVLLCLYFFVPQVAQFFDMFIPQPFAKDGYINLSLQETMGRLYLPFLKEPLLVATGIGTILLAVFFIFVICGSSNAVNLTDGLDGLAAGCLVMVASVLAAIAFLSNNQQIAHYLHILYLQESGEIAIFLCGMVGACLGFLWFNGYPAQVFMGDTGSLSLGAILGISAILLRKEFLFAIAGGVFVIEALSVILQVGSYRLRKKRIFLISPLHHHFEYKGWPETKIVLRFWIISLLLAFFAMISIKLQ